LGRPDTFMAYARRLVDHMHAWYHAPLPTLDFAQHARQLYAVSFFDSIVALEKRQRQAPRTVARGHEGHLPALPEMSHVELRRACGLGDEGAPAQAGRRQ
jgi:hypothetical protein